MKRTYCDRCSVEIIDGNQAVFVHAHAGGAIVDVELCPNCWDEIHDIINAEPVSG